MYTSDLILDESHCPTYDEILCYINSPAQKFWQDMNLFIQEKYKTSPKIMYSKCSGKPGWNVKYHKSGKSICTLYPEKDSFVVLIVITLGLVHIIEDMSDKFETEILEIIKSAKPFNGTLWLMIPVSNTIIADNVKQLIALKHEFK